MVQILVFVLWVAITGIAVAVIPIFLTFLNKVRHYRWIIWDDIKGVWCRMAGHRSKDSVVCERCYQALEINDTGILEGTELDISEVAVPRLYPYNTATTFTYTVMFDAAGNTISIADPAGVIMWRQINEDNS